jgi:uroporphyrinogen decarboxylase
MVSLVREKAPQAKVLFHSDGNITDFIPKFIAAGADIIHCLETGVGNNAVQAKRDYGGQVTFWGALDIKTALQAGPDAIRRDIDAKMAALKPEGGWVFAPENHIQSDVPPEHVLFAFEYAAKAGTCPP